jgi:uncharacterized membrane protein YraQ (UPF0718 family)
MLENLAIFSTVAIAIVIEAAPFLLLGSLIGAMIEVLVSEETLLRFVPRGPVKQVFAGLFAGMLLPTCECGIVPVARRLLLKGVPPRAAFPYMMAAPVVNPVVIGSTLFAFQGDLQVVFLRVLLVLIPAAAFGFALGKVDPRLVLRQGNAAPKAGNGTGGHAGLSHYSAHDHAHEHSHEHSHDHAAGCACAHHGGGHGNRLKAVLFHSTAEFLSMFRFLLLGAVVAAGFKTFIPPEVLGFFANNAFLAVGGLMLLAILLSICSEADAFVAASFVSFPMSSKIAFMAVGPMVDLKLAPMFFAVFHRRIAIALIIVPIVTVFVASTFLALGGW